MQGATARLLVSAAHKSSGKTTISVGLCAALAVRGLVVQPFKKGPDYIDPMWLSRAAGRACRNLDPYLSDAATIASCFCTHGAGADLALVEGNKGLYDGLALDGSNSNAALAGMLGLPVVLVIDARGMTRGIAPLLLGYQAFDRNIRIAGVILNRVGGSRHEGKLRAVVEHYTDMAVVGAVPADPRLAIVERHLGLMPSNEADAAAERIAAIAATVSAHVDLARVLAIAGAADAPVATSPERIAEPTAASGRTAVPPAASGRTAPRADAGELRIGVVQDRAFGFYYADDLGALRAAGATLVPVDSLADTKLPELDGLFIGGGFPEMFAGELEANAPLRAELRAAIAAGLPVYAECGGLMYLARSLVWQGRSYQMVGALPGTAVMHERPVGRGYVTLEATDAFPWPAGAVTTGPVRGHEFHYSSLEGLPADLRYAYTVRRGHGVDGERDGLVVDNVLASYTHLRGGAGSDWPERFVAFVRQVDFRGRRPAAMAA